MTIAKRLLALLLSLALLSAGHVHVFSSSAEPASPTTHTVFSIPETAVSKTQETVTIPIYYETSHAITNGVVCIDFPADKLELVDKDDANTLVNAFPFVASGGRVVNNLKADKGKLVLAFAFAGSWCDSSGILATLTFRVLEQPVYEEDVITVFSEEWCNKDGVNLAEETAIVAVGRLSEVAVSEDGFEYIFFRNSKEVKIVGYVGTSETPIIPESIEGKPVTAIGEQAFVNKDFIRMITIPMSAASIHPDAFLGCYSLALRAPIGSAVPSFAQANGFLFIPLLPDGVQLGEVNGDGKINTTDARQILQYTAGMLDDTDLILAAADVTLDGKVNTSDARRILQYAAGMIGPFIP